MKLKDLLKVMDGNQCIMFYEEDELFFEGYKDSEIDNFLLSMNVVNVYSTKYDVIVISIKGE